MSEVFSSPHESHQGYVGLVVQVVLPKAVSDKAFIRREADACLSSMAAHAVCEELVSALRAECRNRAGQVAEAAFRYLVQTFDLLPLGLLMDL